MPITNRIFAVLTDGMTIAEVARKLDVSRQQVYNILNDKAEIKLSDLVAFSGKDAAEVDAKIYDALTKGLT